MTNSMHARGWILGMRMREACIALMLAAEVASQSSQAQTFTVLHNFAGPPKDGAVPPAGLVRDAAGSLYGTTEVGGASGYGTVFKVDTSGTESVLYSFCSVQNCTDGNNPYGGLVRDTAGNLYGTTLHGGASDYGTVFKVDPSGTESVLYSFCSAQNCTDGNNPYGGLVRDTAGNLYGTTLHGGAYSIGTVFKVDTSGTETVLHSFASGPFDGTSPTGGLVFDKAGNLYGTAEQGGPYSQRKGPPVAMRLDHGKEALVA